MKILYSLALCTLAGCDGYPTPATPTASTGVHQAKAEVHVQASGLTVEQENIGARLEEDNRPGSLKHLYVISAYSGDVILYSTVRGKVTSSGKRLTPYTVAAQDGQYVGSEHEGMRIRIGGDVYRTPEVLQDDGTYGSSEPYIYWWDSKNVYHQHYVSGGQIVHVSSAPIRVARVIINVEASPAPAAP